MTCPVTLVADREIKEHGYPVSRPSLETRDQAAQTDIPYEANLAKRTDQIVQALSVTVQYLAYEVRSMCFIIATIRTLHLFDGILTR